jgi:hypothetical protein
LAADQPGDLPLPWKDALCLTYAANHIGYGDYSRSRWLESKKGGVGWPVRVVAGFSICGVADGLPARQSETQGLRCSQLMVELLPIMATAWSVDEMLIGIRSGRFYPRAESSAARHLSYGSRMAFRLKWADG